MFIAFFIIHSDFSKIDEKIFKSVFTVIQECALDNNICHLYFHSSRNVHKFDKFFSNTTFTRLEMNHIESHSPSIRQRAVDCYQKMASKNPYEYHWIIKIQPDLLFFDRNIFRYIRNKYPQNCIIGRARFYVGPKKLKKNEKSRWYTSEESQQTSYRYHDYEQLTILDDQVYMVPFGLQYHAFLRAEPDFSEQSFWMSSVPNDNSEKVQSLEWVQRNIPLKITELNFVRLSDFDEYNEGD
jgi:hypothetical protein